ncbi:PREDICTED: opsin, ultraviolet-sensitive, partial [Rhagoletis zephyria]|uniref:opsin, ultraviolet-sensitive n=1 Tax=Rhagoletis zephyria TaxID=28612 RepID=UPI00081126F1
CKSLRTPANTLVINLAVSDLLMLMKCPIAIYNNFKQGPALGDAGCRIYGFIGGLSGTASIGTLTAIALDRYNVVVHPLDPLRKTAKVRSAYLITMIWIYSFAFSIVPALDIGLSVYVPEGFLTTCSFDYLDKGLGPRIFMFAFFVAAWCVPFSIICFSYFYILKVVFAANRIQSSKEKNKTEQKLALIVVGIIGLWFLAWTPYSVVAMLGVFGKEKYITPLGSMIPALFCKTAACIDPYFYAATHPRFRMEFRRLWLGRGHLRRTSTTRSSYLTRSSTRRLRVISDVDMRNRSNENAKKQNNLQALQEVTEENDEDYDFSIQGNFSDAIEQSRF